MPKTPSWLTPENAKCVREHFDAPEHVPIVRGSSQRFIVHGLYRYVHAALSKIEYPPEPICGGYYITDRREYETVLFMFPVTTRHGLNFNLYMRIAYDTATKELVWLEEGADESRD